MTYEQWVKTMGLRIEFDGQHWHNLGKSQSGVYIEDWVNGHRRWLTDEEVGQIEFTVGVDLRYIPLGNRNYSDEMWPAYIRMGADKWVMPTAEQMGLTNPPPALDK